MKGILLANNFLFTKRFFLTWGIVIVLAVAEHLLCTKLKSPLWGGIIPLLTIAFTIWCFASGRIAYDQTSSFVFFILNALIFGSWINEREKYKKKQKAELDKMKAHDIDDSQ